MGERKSEWRDKKSKEKIAEIGKFEKDLGGKEERERENE